MTPQPVRSGPSRASSRGRDAIVTAAARFFAERGYAAVGMRDVAEAVGVRGASLYHHFASKEEILYAICLTVTEEPNAQNLPLLDAPGTCRSGSRRWSAATCTTCTGGAPSTSSGCTSWPRSRRSTAPWWTGTAATTSGGCGR